jgi:FAD:protein FMN transferase
MIHKYEYEALGTKLIIAIQDNSVYSYDIDTIFTYVKKFESDYSRFKKWNILDTLNTKKQLEVPQELKSIVSLGLKLSEMTDGYFDMTILPLLENIWYGINTSQLEENIWYKNIEIHWNTITLYNSVNIELWAIWKGYLVDFIYNTLDKKYQNFTVNFGGDIRIKWENTFFLEDPFDEKKSLWEIFLKNLSLAASNPEKRKTKKGTHLVNPKSWNTDTKKAIFITHKLAIFADAFSTALFVSPLEKSLSILEKVDWLEWMIIAENWEIYQSKGFEAKLYI